jgi:hypothetical protein
MPQKSGYSYPRFMAIQIDVHPIGENLIHMTHTFPAPVHVSHAYAFCGQFRTWQPFASHQHRWTDHIGPKKKGSRHNAQHAG